MMSMHVFNQAGLNYNLDQSSGAVAHIHNCSTTRLAGSNEGWHKLKTVSLTGKPGGYLTDVVCHVRL